MPKPHFLTSQVYLTVDDEAVQSSVIKCLAEVIVDQHSHLPDMFSIRLHDPDLKLIDAGPFDLTKTVKIEADTADGTTVTLIEGEITALEPEFAEGMVASLVTFPEQQIVVAVSANTSWVDTYGLAVKIAAAFAR